jgi:hypothetical protein
MNGSRAHTAAVVPSLVCAFVLSCAANAFAQQRPLVTEDPETIGAGRVLLEAGFERSWSADYPASGLEGDLFRVPVLGVSVGIGSIVELQIDGGWQHLSIVNRFPAPMADRLVIEGDSTSSFEDTIVATKIKLLSENAGRPGLGVRLATKLPTASNETGLGLDTMDFFATLLVGKTVASVRWVGNVGLGIVSNPIEVASQDDELMYGFSLARALTDKAEMVGEINGRIELREGVAPPGLESRGLIRAGLRYTMGAGRIDGGVLFGLTASDPGFGITAGYTYVFNAFRMP